jgi:hypothetical protein
MLLILLKSCRCSWTLTLNALPVCPVYFILHSGHVSWYIPLLSYVFCGVSCFIARRFSIVLSVVNAIFTSVFLNSFVINLVSFPVYVNLAHLCLRLSCLCPLPSFKLSREALYLLLSKTCRILSLYFCLFSGVSGVLRWLLESLGKRHAYLGQMKSMTPHGITGLERVKLLNSCLITVPTCRSLKTLHISF